MEGEIQKVRKFSIASIVLFAISALIYIFLLFLLIGTLRFTYEFQLIIIVIACAIDVAVLTLSVIALINVVRNLSQYKGLGFCTASILLSLIPGILGPFIIIEYFLSF